MPTTASDEFRKPENSFNMTFLSWISYSNPV